jgi:hypothetical protein
VIEENGKKNVLSPLVRYRNDDDDKTNIILTLGTHHAYIPLTLYFKRDS